MSVELSARGTDQLFGSFSRRPNLSHEPVVQYLSIKDLPITVPTRSVTPGELQSPIERGWGPSSVHRIHSPFRQRLIGGRYFKGNKLFSRRQCETFTGHHHQPFYSGDTATHPECSKFITVYQTLRRIQQTPPMLQPFSEYGIHSGPKRGTSRILLAWLLRCRWSPFDTSCVPHRFTGEFEQVILYRYGPAQVGFDQPWHPAKVWSHRL